jgi:hypothetical protein
MIDDFRKCAVAAANDHHWCFIDRRAHLPRQVIGVIDGQCIDQVDPGRNELVMRVLERVAAVAASRIDDQDRLLRKRAAVPHCH